MVPEPDDGAKEHVSWGEEASLQQLRDFFPDFCPPIQALLDLAPNMQKYALFAGPRLKTVTAHGSVALIGDASHPLSGAFGNGAGFAFEDAVVLAKSIDWAHTRGRPLSEALELFDNTRSPHYSNLYAVLDKFGEADAEIKGQRLTYDEEVSLRIEKNWTSKHEWMYYYKVGL
jgi:salicylate hydroxylase